MPPRDIAAAAKAAGATTTSTIDAAAGIGDTIAGDTVETLTTTRAPGRRIKATGPTPTAAGTGAAGGTLATTSGTRTGSGSAVTATAATTRTRACSSPTSSSRVGPARTSSGAAPATSSSPTTISSPITVSSSPTTRGADTTTISRAAAMTTTTAVSSSQATAIRGDSTTSRATITPGASSGAGPDTKPPHQDSLSFCHVPRIINIPTLSLPAIDRVLKDAVTSSTRPGCFGTSPRSRQPAPWAASRSEAWRPFRASGDTLARAPTPSPCPCPAPTPPAWASSPRGPRGSHPGRSSTPRARASYPDRPSSHREGPSALASARAVSAPRGPVPPQSSGGGRARSPRARGCPSRLYAPDRAVCPAGSWVQRERPAHRRRTPRTHPALAPKIFWLRASGAWAAFRTVSPARVPWWEPRDPRRARIHPGPVRRDGPSPRPGLPDRSLCRCSPRLTFAGAPPAPTQTPRARDHPGHP
mmetsp:Transcript_5900/g.24147  ORF Transcript_5900/g.24147 Transcript_5900/m.24147 type:complete len:472 (-) Transcript_5900:372-1787(-)